MNKFILTSLVMFFSLGSLSAQAANAWYDGQVDILALTNNANIPANQGSFVITFKNNVLDDCQYKYAYFMVADLGSEQVKAAYSMALTSLTTGIEMGVIIDKAAGGVGGTCKATGMTARLQAK